MRKQAKISLSKLEGIVKVFGGNINTDLIMPSQYLDNPDPEYYSQFVMSGLNPNFVQEIKKLRDEHNLPAIIVAGKNFGSGSSREQAPSGLKHAGVICVLAESFNTIFFRNAINIGLPVAIVSNISKQVKEHFHLRLNLEKGSLDILQPEMSQISFDPLESFLLRRLANGGLLPELKKYVGETKLGKQE